MGLSRVSYNGYTFPDRSNFSVREEYVYDDSRRTVAYTRFLIRVESIVVADYVPSNGNYDAPELYAGSQMQVLRQRLSKVGCELKIEHDGFGPRPHITVGADGTNPIRDVNFGPKPRMLAWNPVGHTTCAEVVWECEFCIPVSDGASGAPNFEGLSSYNYAISYDIDHRGYTTRRIHGTIEIAMARDGRRIPDSIDQYRDLVTVAKPSNFQRSVHWNVSMDKRRADFVIVDSEIASNNVWPNGVVDIRAHHRATWDQTHGNRLGNAIFASIELSATESRFRAWEIFRAIVKSRIDYAGDVNTFLEALVVSEELFENRITFEIHYRTVLPNVGSFFTVSGMLQPIENFYNGEARTWGAWSQSVRHLQPFQDNGTDRGLAQLEHRFDEERIIDLGDPSLAPVSAEPATRGNPLPTPVGVFCNPLPEPEDSWLRFKSILKIISGNKTATSISLGPDDLQYNDLDLFNTEATLDRQRESELKTIIESYADVTAIEWEGAAERYGYRIPMPGILRLDGQTLRPSGRSNFEQEYLGTYFCQPLYRAYWKRRYVVQKKPDRLRPEGNDKVDGPRN